MGDEGIPLCEIERSAERHAVVTTWLTISEMLHDLYLPGVPTGSAVEGVHLAAMIFQGHVEKRPFTLTKLALVSGLSPTTVRRKLEPLITGGVIERRRDRTYAVCEGRVNSPVIMTKVSRIVAVLHVAPRKLEHAINRDALVGTSANLDEAQGAP